MARKIYYPAIVTGVLLLFLAVIIAVRLDTAVDHALVEQRTAVAETVKHLENGCLTCHQSTQSQALVTPVSYSIERRSLTHVESHASALQVDVDAQLVDLGQRILALPVTKDQSRAAAAFLNTYQETRQITSENVSSSLSLIDSLKVILRDQENQANPNQLRRAEGKDFQSSLSSALVVPSGSGTAFIYHSLPLGNIVLERWTLVHDMQELVLPNEIVFAAHRRGPPSDSAFVPFLGVGWETAVL